MFIDAHENGVTLVSSNCLYELKTNLMIIQQYINDGKCPQNRIRAMKFALEDGMVVLKNLRKLQILSISDFY